MKHRQSTARRRLVSLIGALALVATGVVVMRFTATADEPRPRDLRVLAYEAMRGAPAETHYGKGQTFRTLVVSEDDDGDRHVRMDRYYRGLPVVGGDLVLHMSKDGRLKGTSQTLKAAPAVEVDPKLSREDAWKRTFAHTPVLRKASKGGKAKESDKVETQSRAGARLVVWAGGAKGPRLAWENVIRASHKDGTPAEVYTFVDASSGKVLGTRDRYRQEQGTGRTLYSGEVRLETSASQDGNGFQLTDTTRGGLTTLDANGQCIEGDPDCQPAPGGPGGPGGDSGGPGGPGGPP